MSATIVVILGEPEWTQRALHLAAALAREWRAAVTLVKLLPVAHLEYLGAGVDETLLPYKAVSYTHLDVYKRQTRNRPIHRRPDRKRWATIGSPNDGSHQAKAPGQ